jgi:hypothetical protein
LTIATVQWSFYYEIDKVVSLAAQTSIRYYTNTDGLVATPYFYWHSLMSQADSLYLSQARPSWLRYPPADNGTGTRGNCMEKSPPLTRLVGSSNNLALTVNDYPTFWVYVPYTPEEAPSGEFSLHDGKNDIYRTRFQLPATPGIVKISLPPTTKGLEIGKTYRWYLTWIVREKTHQTKNPLQQLCQDLLQRVSRPELESQLKAVQTPLSVLLFMPEMASGFDAVTELAQLR